MYSLVLFIMIGLIRVLFQMLEALHQNRLNHKISLIKLYPFITICRLFHNFLRFLLYF